MFNLMDYPFLVLLVTLPAFWVASRLGRRIRERQPPWDKDADDDYRFVLGGTLTLLGLLIGFSFSMAVGRYDLRKGWEEKEANAVGTEYARAGLMPPEDATRLRALLRDYADQRIRHYYARPWHDLGAIDDRASKLQGEMWTLVAAHGRASPTPVAGVVAEGMNAVIDAQGFAQAAGWNRIPDGAWALLVLMSLVCNLLVGLGAHGNRIGLHAILPAVLAVTLYFVADIESPRGGLILVHPVNLESTAASLRTIFGN